MKVADALRQAARLFLDTAPVIYYVERHPRYAAVVDDIFDRFDTGALAAVTSPVTLAECLVVPCRLGQASVRQGFVDLIVHGPSGTFVSLGETVACRAAELRAAYGVSLTDALQIAAALAASCDAFLTNDTGLKRVRELPILIVDELET